jgi:branched-chain amino acid transport system permease protein
MNGRVPLWLIGYLVLLGLAVAYPFVFDSAYLVNVGILVLFAAYQGSAWNILGGFTGLFSFGHAAFFGLGAYTSTMLFVHLGITPWLGMLAGGLVAAGVGVGFGYLTVRYRVRGHYFALGMFAFAELLRFSAQNLGIIGGSVGILIPFKGDAPEAFQFVGKTPYYWVILGMLVVIVAVSRVLKDGRLGYFWASIRSDDTAAEMAGVNTLRYKLAAMGLSAFFMALAGTFYAQFTFFIEPSIVFGVDKSLDGLLRAVVGGLGLVLGPLFGALLLTPLGELTKTLLPVKNASGADLVLFGILLILAIRFMPRGVLGTLERAFVRLRRWRVAA